MTSLKALSADISRLFRERGQRAAGLSFFGKVVLVPLFSCVAAISQFTDFDDGRATLAQLAGISASLVVAVLSFILGFAEKDGSEELAKALEAVETAREAQADLTAIDALELEHEQAIQLVESISLMRAVIETVLMMPTGTEAQLVQALLRASSRNMRVALGFQSSHRWTITIYRAEGSGGSIMLVPIATDRAIPCDLNHARSWEIGTGIAGASFANGCEVVIPDLTRPGLKELFGTKANETKPDDYNLYRSMAASPVRLDGALLPWGVVVATNDQLDHFNADGFSAMRPDVVVKELSGIVALAAAAYRRVAAIADKAPVATTDRSTAGTNDPAGGLTGWIQRMFNHKREG